MTGPLPEATPTESDRRIWSDLVGLGRTWSDSVGVAPGRGPYDLPLKGTAVASSLCSINVSVFQCDAIMCSGK